MFAIQVIIICAAIENNWLKCLKWMCESNNANSFATVFETRRSCPFKPFQRFIFRWCCHYRLCGSGCFFCLFPCFFFLKNRLILAAVIIMNHLGNDIRLASLASAWTSNAICTIIDINNYVFPVWIEAINSNEFDKIEESVSVEYFLKSCLIDESVLF